MASRRLVAPLVIAAAVAGGGVAGAALGVPAISGAQEAPDTSTPEARPEGRFPGRGAGIFEAAAEALGIEPEALHEQLRDGSTIAEVAEAQGVDIATVIDAMVAAAVDGQRSEAEIREQITALVDEGLPERPGGFGRGGPGRMHVGGEQLDAAAEALGLERDELVAALRDGRTIAEIAQEQGVDVQTVVDAMVGEARERIESFVNEGFQRPEAAPDDPEAGTTPDAEGSTLS